ncbi:unnamed protein product, partial [Caenorhabditis bovis]
VDFYLGLPLAEQARVARIFNPNVWNVISEILYSPNDFNLKRFILDRLNNGSLTRVENTTPWLRFIGSMTLNNPEYHQMEQAAVMGIGTARAMASIFELLRTEQIVSKSTLDEMLSNYEVSDDYISGAKVPRGQGLMLAEFKHNGVDVKLYGHSGYGGQNIRTDFNNNVTIAYMSNGLKVGFGDTARTYKRLLNSVYDVVLPSG